MGYEEIMDEIHRIRESIFEETENMTVAERVEWMRNETADIISAMGLTIIPNREKLRTG